ncbi:MAG: response regulator [Syntrophomonadaceae bacterium]|nr:response regulator [Syntrophomonadaceae bacterium]
MKGEALVILLVEDNEDHAELVKRQFEVQRIANRIIHVGDGEEALDYLFRRGQYTDDEEYPLPNLILLDLRLPKMDGLSVLSEIKKSEQLRVIPTVVLTSSESEKDIKSAYINYVNSFLVKPIDFSKFAALMDELGMYWLGWNTNPYK